MLLQQLSLAQLLFPSFEWFPKGFRWLHAHKADGMPNATTFIAADHYLLLLDAEGQNPLRGLAKLNAIPVYSIGNNVLKRVGRHVLPLARGPTESSKQTAFQGSRQLLPPPGQAGREAIRPQYRRNKNWSSKTYVNPELLTPQPQAQ